VPESTLRAAAAAVLLSAVSLCGAAEPAGTEADPPAHSKVRRTDVPSLPGYRAPLKTRAADTRVEPFAPGPDTRAAILGPTQEQLERIAARAPGSAALLSANSYLTLPYDPNVILAGHLLRRAGFGSNPKEIKKVAKKPLTKWIDKQLNPDKISDAMVNAQLPPPPADPSDDYDWIRRWYIRMAITPRQLQEKLTLIWHEHFAVSNEKVGYGQFMADYETLLRKHSLGTFRDMLVDITRDQAMLIWLDNDYNDGTSSEPPNENYAREFMQLFSTGTTQLNLDGSQALDGSGNAVPAYSENDVREIARAMTGFYVPYPYKPNNSDFDPSIHDAGSKTIMGVTLPGRSGVDGALEVDDVVDLILAQRQTTVAAFISKALIQKLATETPTPQYVSDVASEFVATGGSIKAVVRAILVHPEFTSPAVVRSQLKEPIEQYLNAVRAFNAPTGGDALIEWTYDSGQLIYYPPSVFSFYPPGQKGVLLNTAMVFQRDEVADEFTRASHDTWLDVSKLRKAGKFKTSDAAVDYISDALLTAPLQTEYRTEVLNYMNGEITDDKVKGAVWLILCSPDFQVN